MILHFLFIIPTFYTLIPTATNFIFDTYHHDPRKFIIIVAFSQQKLISFAEVFFGSLSHCDAVQKKNIEILSLADGMFNQITYYMFDKINNNCHLL